MMAGWKARRAPRGNRAFAFGSVKGKLALTDHARQHGELFFKFGLRACPMLGGEGEQARQRSGAQPLFQHIQMNADSIIGDDGFMVKRFCKKVMKEEMLDFVGSDGHDMGKRTPHLGKASEKVARMMGEDYADMIFISNPECILNHERFQYIFLCKRQAKENNRVTEKKNGKSGYK